MSKIVWDQTGERYLESGVSRGVLYATVPENQVVANNFSNPSYSSAIISVDSADMYPYGEGNRVQIRMNVADPCRFFSQYRSHHQAEGSTPNFKYAFVTLKNRTPVTTAENVAASVGATPSGDKAYSLGEFSSSKMSTYASTLGRLRKSTITDLYDMGVLKDQWVVSDWARFSFSNGSSTVPPAPCEIAQVDELFYYTESGRDYIKAFVDAAVANASSSLPLGSEEYWSVGASNVDTENKYVDVMLFTDSAGVFSSPEKRTGNMCLVMYSGEIREEVVRVSVGVPWNGLLSVGSSPEGAEDNDQWADNMKYSRTKSKETWGGTIEAYQSPKEFDECDGTIEASPGVNVGQQKRNSFGLCYRTEIMSDASGGESCGYLLHLLYNLTASPSERSYETINDSPDAITLSWELDGVPINVDGYEPLTEITVDSRYADSTGLSDLENILYGTAETNPRLPAPEELIDLFT